MKIELKNNNVIETLDYNSETIRGKRSQLLFIADSKEYYKGIKIILWYWYRLINFIKKKILRKENYNMCYSGRCKYEIKEGMFKDGCGVLCGQEIPVDALCKYEDINIYINKHNKDFNVEEFKKFLIEISNKGDVK